MSQPPLDPAPPSSNPRLLPAIFGTALILMILLLIWSVRTSRRRHWELDEVQVRRAALEAASPPALTNVAVVPTQPTQTPPPAPTLPTATTQSVGGVTFTVAPSVGGGVGFSISGTTNQPIQAAPPPSAVVTTTVDTNALAQAVRAALRAEQPVTDRVALRSMRIRGGHSEEIVRVAGSDEARKESLVELTRALADARRATNAPAGSAAALATPAPPAPAATSAAPAAVAAPVQSGPAPLPAPAATTNAAPPMPPTPVAPPASAVEPVREGTPSVSGDAGTSRTPLAPTKSGALPLLGETPLLRRYVGALPLLGEIREDRPFIILTTVPGPALPPLVPVSASYPYDPYVSEPLYGYNGYYGGRTYGYGSLPYEYSYYPHRSPSVSYRVGANGRTYMVPR